MRRHLQSLFKKLDYLRIGTLVVMLVLIATSLVRAVVPVELQDLYQASTKQDINANKFVGALNTCDQTGTCQHPFAINSTTLSYLLGTATGMTQIGAQAYRLGPPLPNEKYLSYSPGALGTATDYMALALGKPIISNREYVADVLHNLRIPGVDPAYAQGLGFSSLSPVLNLWKLFRNLAYFFFVVIFLVVGMMIMFRSKIGNQAAVTVQQALPKMILSLLLVTFSYAIAGLMVDVMYLIIYLAIAIFQAPELSVTALTQIAFRGNFIGNVIGNGDYSLLGQPIGGQSVVGSIAGALGNIVIGALNINPNDLLGQVVQGGSNLIFTVVIAFALLASIFRVFFALVQAYIGIFFSVIFSPIILLIGAFPGQNTFGSWLKGLLENLLVFPVLIILIFIGFYFTRVQLPKGADQLGFSPPQLGSNQGTTGFAVYQSLIPFAAILAMPEILKIAKGILKGQLDINPGQLVKDARNRANTLAGASIPLAAGVAGAGYGIAQGGLGGLGTKQPFRLSNLWSGYTDPITKKQVGGLRQGFGTGYQKGRGAARLVDNALELKFADPNSVSQLVEQMNKRDRLEEQRKLQEELAAAATKNRRPGP